MPIFDFSNSKPIPAYMLSDDEELRNDYLQNVDEDPYFSDYDGSGGEYEPEEDDNESLHSKCEEININTDYYDIFFMLPKEKRKEIIYNNEFKEEYLKRKRQRNLEKYKYEFNIKYFKRKNKKKLNKELKKPKESNLITDIDLFISDFMQYYNNNLVTCKEPKCKEKCGYDIKYCLNHYPEVCEKCNYICDKSNLMDKLTYNKFSEIYNYCNKCTIERHKEIFREKLPEEKLFHQIVEGDEYNELFSTLNFKNLLLNTEIYNELIKLGEKDGLSKQELREKLCEPQYLSYIGMKKEEITLYTRYELWRKYDKSSDLINTFKDKLKYIKITDFRLRKWGTLQYQAFKDYLYDILYKDDEEYNNLQNICNNILENVIEPDTPYPVNDEIEHKICINCGTEDTLPNNTLCLPCKFST